MCVGSSIVCLDGRFVVLFLSFASSLFGLMHFSFQQQEREDYQIPTSPIMLYNSSAHVPSSFLVGYLRIVAQMTPRLSSPTLYISMYAYAS